MANNTNTLKTRIQLKSDTEDNWNKAGPKDGSAGFVPLLGELIVYTVDKAHPFSRIKIGDGKTNVIDLPFVDNYTNTKAISDVIQWSAGRRPSLTCEKGILQLDIGYSPSLTVAQNTSILIGGGV